MGKYMYTVRKCLAFKTCWSSSLVEIHFSDCHSYHGESSDSCYYQVLGMNNLQPLSVIVMKNYEAVQDGDSLLNDLQDTA